MIRDFFYEKNSKKKKKEKKIKHQKIYLLIAAAAAGHQTSVKKIADKIRLVFFALRQNTLFFAIS